MTTTTAPAATIAPGVNLPSLMHIEDKVGSLFVEVITANADGSLTHDLDALGKWVGTSENGHFALVPSWTRAGAEVGILRLRAGMTVRCYGSADNAITVELPDGFGEVTFTDQVVVIAHADLDGAALKAYYAG